MKLIEALKNLKTIEKRIEKNSAQIPEYAAYVNTENPHFETAEKQETEVAALVQSNLDLASEYLRLKTAIEYTNLNTKVTIGTRTHSISELITLRGAKNRPGTGRFAMGTYGSLHPQRAVGRLQQTYNRPGGVNITEPPKVVLAYREEDKQKALRDWEEFLSAIDGKLEVVNAETELQNY